jgi:hypothetical protein
MINRLSEHWSPAGLSKLTFSERWSPAGKNAKKSPKKGQNKVLAMTYSPTFRQYHRRCSA